MCAVHSHDFFIQIFRVTQTGQRHESGGLFAVVRIGDIGAHFRGRGCAFFGKLRFAQSVAEVHTGIKCQDHQGLQTGMDGFGVSVAGPIQETAAGHFFHTFFVHAGKQLTQETGQIRLLLLQVVQIAVDAVPVIVDQQPPDGVGADAVHPGTQRCFIADQIQTARHHPVIAENRIDGHCFRMHVADPDQSVAFETVPHVVLHIQLDCVGARLPDLVQAFIIGHEGTQVGQIVEQENGTGELKAHRAVGLYQIYTRKAVTGVADLCRTQPGNQSGLIADGVVIGRVFIAADVVHDFTDGFTEADTYLDRFTCGGAGASNLDAA